MRAVCYDFARKRRTSRHLVGLSRQVNNDHRRRARRDVRIEANVPFAFFVAAVFQCHCERSEAIQQSKTKNTNIERR